MSQAKKTKTNYYLTLDLMPGANHNEILHAYNRAKSTYSSGSLASYTLLEDESNQSILDEIEEAFLILGNPAKRRAYDLDRGYDTWAEDGVQKTENEFDLQQMMRSSSQVKKNDQGKNENGEATKGKDSGSAFSRPNQGHANERPDSKVIPMKAPRDAAIDRGDDAASSVFEPNPDFERKVQECTEVNGPFLKAVRIYRGLTPELLASRCKLSASHVLALENEEHAPNQAPVYLRGHIYLVCQALELPDANGLAKKYVERMSSEGKLQRRNF